MENEENCSSSEKALKEIKSYFHPKQLLLKEKVFNMFDIIGKDLSDYNKIKARLIAVNMKLNSKRKECVDNMEHTDEDDFVHEASKIEMECIDWFRKMLQEVLSCE